jgi:hypothetical protein
MRQSIKRKPRPSAVLFIVNHSAQKIWLRHRVTLMEAGSYQNRTPISEIFFSVEYMKVLSTKLFWNLAFNVGYIRWTGKNNHITLNFLSLFRHRVTLGISHCNILMTDPNKLIFSDVVQKTEVHHPPKEQIF